MQCTQQKSCPRLEAVAHTVGVMAAASIVTRSFQNERLGVLCGGDIHTSSVSCLNKDADDTHNPTGSTMKEKIVWVGDMLGLSMRNMVVEVYEAKYPTRLVVTTIQTIIFSLIAMLMSAVSVLLAILLIPFIMLWSLEKFIIYLENELEDIKINKHNTKGKK